MSDANYSKSGWYDKNNFAFDEDTACDYLREVYLNEVRSGVRSLSLPADEFEGQSYSDILDWSFTKWMDTVTEHITTHGYIITPVKTFTYHDAGDARTMVWFNMSSGRNIISYYSCSSFRRAMYLLDVPLSEISEYMGDHCPSRIPESGDVLQVVLDSMDVYTLEDGSNMTAVPFDAVFDLYAIALGEWIVANDVTEFSLGPRMNFKFGYLDELQAEYDEEQGE